jgi:hypothetical protein
VVLHVYPILEIVGSVGAKLVPDVVFTTTMVSGCLAPYVEAGPLVVDGRRNGCPTIEEQDVVVDVQHKHHHVCVWRPLGCASTLPTPRVPTQHIAIALELPHPTRIATA